MEPPDEMSPEENPRDVPTSNTPGPAGFREDFAEDRTPRWGEDD
jgi:hypothetical protein